MGKPPEEDIVEYGKNEIKPKVQPAAVPEKKEGEKPSVPAAEVK